MSDHLEIITVKDAPTVDLHVIFLSFASVLKVRGFFKGMALPLTTVSMTSSVAFGTYRNCLHCLSQARGASGGPNTKMEVFLSGLAGGVAQVRDTD